MKVDQEPRPEISVPNDAQNLIKTLQESLKRQSSLEKTVKTLENNKNMLLSQQSELKGKLQKSESQKLILLERVNALQKEMATKQNLSHKCSSLEKQLRDAEDAIKTINSSRSQAETQMPNLFGDLTEILDSINASFKYPENLSKLTLKEDKFIKDI